MSISLRGQKQFQALTIISIGGIFNSVFFIFVSVSVFLFGLIVAIGNIFA